MGHAFSVEMTSREHVNRIYVSNDTRSPVVFEGELKIRGLRIVEDLMLEVNGVNGILRIDLTAEEFEHYCKPETCTCMRGDKSG